MTTSITANVHYKPGEVRHKWSPAAGTCEAYGTLRFGAHSLNEVCVFLDTPADIDEVIAELVALRAEMAPEPAWLLDCGHKVTGTPLAPGEALTCPFCKHTTVAPAASGASNPNAPEAATFVYRLGCGCVLQPTPLTLKAGLQSWCSEHGETVITGPAETASVTR